MQSKFYFSKACSTLSLPQLYIQYLKYTASWKLKPRLNCEESNENHYIKKGFFCLSSYVTHPVS